MGEDEEIIDEDNENPEEENQVDKETESGSNENNDQEHQNSQDKDQTSNSNKDNSNKLDNPTKQPVDTSVKTSDTTNATYYISLLVLSFGLIAIRKKLKFNK